MDTIVLDEFVQMPPAPLAAASVVLWDSGAGATPADWARKTHRVAGTLKTDLAWTLKVQQLLSDGTTWQDANAGTAVLAGASLDFNVYVAGGGRRRVVAVFAAAPATWLHSGTLRLIPQANFVA